MKARTAAQTEPNALLRLLSALLIPIAAIAGTHFALGLLGLDKIEHLLDVAFGLSIGMVVFRGWRAIPGTLISHVAIQMSLHVALPTALALGGMETFAVCLTAVLLLRIGHFRPGFARQRDLFVFLIIGAAIGPMISGLLWAVAYGVFNGAWGMFAGVIKLVWLTHASGTLAIAPLLLCRSRLASASSSRTHPSLPRAPRRQMELGSVALLGVASGYIAWCDPFELGIFLASIAFVPFAFSMWAALRLGSQSATIVNVLIVLIAAYGASSGGMLANSGMHGTSSLLFAFIAISTSCSLLAATIIYERNTAAIERRDLEVRLRQAEKLESLGMLAGGVAHDFNNLLTPILAGADLLTLGGTSPDNEEVLINVKRASRQARRLCQQLLAYAGRAGIEREVVELSNVVRDTEALVKHLGDSRTSIEFDYTASSTAIEIDVAQLQQVLLNLTKNATEAMAGKQGKIVVATLVEDANDDFLQSLHGSKRLKPGRFVGLRITDPGTGIAPESLQKVFDPFYSTKGGNRGLGLAGVIGITQAHNGGVAIESAEGVGTKITAWFPATTRAPSPRSPTPHPDRRKVDGAVLIVDDDPKVRFTARRVLESSGMTVLEAEDGETAISVVSNPTNVIDLVLLDLSMPGVDGHETFAQLHAMRPSLPVILSSGYDQIRSEGSLADRGYAAFLQKPYDSSALLQRVNDALLSPDGAGS